MRETDVALAVVVVLLLLLLLLLPAAELVAAAHGRARTVVMLVYVCVNACVHLSCSECSDATAVVGGS